jgi:hypothetical protein
VEEGEVHGEPRGRGIRRLIISTARYGLFVELADLFVEGLVPIDTLPGDRYAYHENVRKIIGQRTRRGNFPSATACASSAGIMLVLIGIHLSRHESPRRPGFLFLLSLLVAIGRFFYWK